MGEPVFGAGEQLDRDGLAVFEVIQRVAMFEASTSSMQTRLVLRSVNFYCTTCYSSLKFIA